MTRTAGTAYRRDPRREDKGPENLIICYFSPFPPVLLFSTRFRARQGYKKEVLSITKWRIGAVVTVSQPQLDSS